MYLRNRFSIAQPLQQTPFFQRSEVRNSMTHVYALEYEESQASRFDVTVHRA